MKFFFEVLVSIVRISLQPHMRERVMLTKKLTLSFIFLVSTSILSASEMESVLEVGRENSSQSAVSQEKN